MTKATLTIDNSFFSEINALALTMSGKKSLAVSFNNEKAAAVGTTIAPAQSPT